MIEVGKLVFFGPETNVKWINGAHFVEEQIPQKGFSILHSPTQSRTKQNENEG